jgi:hypothetical protein
MTNIDKIIRYLSKIPTRQIIALSLTALFIALSLKDKIESAQVATIYGMIIGFYFGNKTALETPDGYSLNKDKDKTVE